jgi:hypothetical protein
MFGIGCNSDAARPQINNPDSAALSKGARFRAFGLVVKIVSGLSRLRTFCDCWVLCPQSWLQIRSPGGSAQSSSISLSQRQPGKRSRSIQTDRNRARGLAVANDDQVRLWGNIDDLTMIALGEEIRLATGLMPVIMIALGQFFLSKFPLDKVKEDDIEDEMLSRHRVVE